MLDRVPGTGWNPAHESALDIFLSAGGVQSGMCACSPVAQQNGTVDRNLQAFSDVSCQEIRLVESSGKVAKAMQWDRQDASG